jgi:predicted HicB family RNase H-like nuclease
MMFRIQPTKETKETLSIRLTTGLLVSLKQTAQRNGVSVSELIRQCIQHCLPTDSTK